jgi:hydroxymethylbilane synthase
MGKHIKIGTRESALATWQATLVKDQLAAAGQEAELVFIKSEGDIDLHTPLYEIGVQGIFTRSLDAALLSGRIDIAVHSMKDVPTQPAKGIIPAAILERASYKDLFVYKNSSAFLEDPLSAAVIATSSIRRKAQWLHRYPHHTIENLRGNVNTRLQKLQEQHWQGAIFAAAGLERIGLRPEYSIELDWMLPAPAQGAIMVVCRENDTAAWEACQPLHHTDTAICTNLERAFLRTLLGGCSTPISAHAVIAGEEIHFKGNILSPNGEHIASIEKNIPVSEAETAGETLAAALIENGGQSIIENLRNA